MNIAVIGMGYVGITTALLFCKLKYKVVGVDTNASKLEQLQKGRLPLYEPGLEELLNRHLTQHTIAFTSDIEQAVKTCDIIFITVGTPSKADGFTDLRYIKEVAGSIGRYQNAYKIVVMKSTVPVGTSEKVREWVIENQSQPFSVDVVCNPEFLREGMALYDALHPDRIIIGAERAEAAEKIKYLYTSIASPKLITRLRTAELIKYTANAFLALKISYINEIGRLCDAHGVDVGDVADGIGMDQRIGRAFLNAGIGWGGSCFPKDIASLMHMFEQKNIKPDILPAVQRVNETQVTYYIQRLEKLLGGVQGKNISVLGIAFKPNTDDIREAPAMKVIQKLHQKGAYLKVYDPVVFKHRQLQLPAMVCTKVEEAFEESDCIFLLTEWDSFVQMNWEQYLPLMKTPMIMDGRNALDGHALRQIGYMYYGIGKNEK
ncbi:UDP-glucose dehydrogenase family protein [Polycladomyces subterraneus]|uniref:UDP-glucose 6-dehydrogenase n=1 Tax=Polycladomyces subterraneus TaxID=1016997 RepID=A0ABT8IP43_9BACL|nr:UDP-glucose/GDP-mannose dehydrogenase family protein [Polycladomyces subterraneus]MDN4594152.1 UDP-glucose/GDP-mannose dehydrogenase family protein [Polycladomyces subterraneus]